GVGKAPHDEEARKEPREGWTRGQVPTPELASHGGQDGARRADRISSEKHPGDHDCDEDGESLGPRDADGPSSSGDVPWPHGADDVIHHEVNSVERAPGDESPARSMPEASEQHRRPEIGIATRAARPV